MAKNNQNIIRVLVADDEPKVLEAYRSVLNTDKPAASEAVIDLRAKLFGGEKSTPDSSPVFDLVLTPGAEAAVAAVQDSLEQNNPFALAFLDMRMPPGPDGAWAAAQIRALDSRIDLVIASAYSDIEPGELAKRVPPIEKLFYVQKPFHPHEIRQLAVALGLKQRAEAKISRLAYYDSLTGLPNRELFLTRLEQAVDLAQRRQNNLAIIFLDLDNFKRINDTLGHGVGDELLKTMGHRMLHCLRTSDAATRLPATEPEGQQMARLGGDEFTILLSDLDQPKDAFMVAERIRTQLSEPMQLADHSIVVTPSLGIAVYPQDGDNVEAMLKSADMAMYYAKHKGRNNVQLFNETMSEAALKRMTLEHELRQAIERDELSLHYQPQLDLVTGQVTGLEALLRWHNPALGNIPPLEFIVIAEDSGLIIEIGEWVLRTACTQAKSWHDAGLCMCRIAVNVSVLQFVQTTFPDTVSRVLLETGLPANLLELEITETVLMKDAGNAIDTLTQLKNIGVQLAIDDFGTGYSSLSHLKQFPIDRLKIDRSFINTITSSADDQAIAYAVIAMAETMQLKVTAEGVENAGQLNLLKNEHCDEVQGFHISRPLTAADADAFLEQLQSNKHEDVPC